MKSKTARIAGLMIFLLIVCLIIAPKNNGEASAASVLDLVPHEQKQKNNEELMLFVPQKAAVAATADGILSDLLTPNVEVNSNERFTASEDDRIRVLLYHTHTTEAYRQDGEDTYKESGDYRTYDNERNIVAVGEVLKRELETLDFEVIHDITDHEPPKLSTSYSRSLVTMESYAEDDIDIYIDLHRDASGSANTDDIVTVNGERCARMMFVVGKGIKSNGTEYDPKPNFEKTYAFAEAIAANIREYDDKFMRETRVKNGRYNQHISDHCILVEMGHNMNTLAEAKNSAVYLAKAIYKTMNTK